MYIEKCIKCKKLPKIVKITDLYYCQCSTPGCKKWDKYFALGSTEKNAIEVWNLYNRPIKRGKKGLELDESSNL